MATRDAVMSMAPSSVANTYSKARLAQHIVRGFIPAPPYLPAQIAVLVVFVLLLAFKFKFTYMHSVVLGYLLMGTTFAFIIHNIGL